MRIRRIARVGLAGALLIPALLMISETVQAVVIQINGQVVPVPEAAPRPHGRPYDLQVAFARGENGCPDPNNDATCYNDETVPNPDIDPVFDASETPGVFGIPTDDNGNFRTVTFANLEEFAGFENTFGWYNVGDDLTNLSNLHQVITCYPTNYEAPGGWENEPDLNNPPAARLSVDFQAEYANGNYKGGFVGFFLVTPEGESASCAPQNCGRPTDPLCVGRIYYTEKEINGDGNYVHFLIYQTKLLDTDGKRRNDFYFAFEDLFRGGDNDFSDQVVLVKGLVKPCEPSEEICDGIDNNCDGEVDNIAPQKCHDPSNPLKGVCQEGNLVCINGATECQGEILPGSESCNGLDDDCDGVVDNPPGGHFVPPLEDACPPGSNNGPCEAVTECTGGVATCRVITGPGIETCNGIDDDCDNVIDDHLTDMGGPCANGPTVGQCKEGKTACVNGAPVCQGYQGPQPEVCDGIDNNCDGQIDEVENLVDDGGPCTPPGAVDVCQVGHEVCVGGTLVCQGFVLGSPEVCNGLDDDCDGIIDDNLIDTGGPCGNDKGICEPGAYQCVPEVANDPTTDMLVCVDPDESMPEVCNGLDDDCDGFVDEGTLPGVGDPCDTGCGTGVKVCKHGALICEVNGRSTQEVCNGIDDDCDGLIDNDDPDLVGVNEPCFNDDVVLYPPCMPGHTVCVADQQGGAAIQCQGATTGSPEVCNGIDDDCNGIIDDGNLPSVGDQCLPPGVSQDQLGDQCKPGELACIAGELVCRGATGPKDEICNGIDDDCDGVIDEPNPCPGDLVCVTGECRLPCRLSGEFDTCPGGQHCSHGYCKNDPDAGAGGSGGESSGLDAGTETGDGASGSHTDAGHSGNGGSSNGHDAGSSGHNNHPNDLNGDGKPDQYGLATGGGGCACKVSQPETGGSWGFLMATGLLGVFVSRRSTSSRRRSR